MELYRLQNEKDYIGKKCYEVLQQRRPRVDIKIDQTQHFPNNPATLHNYHSPRHTKRAENRRLTPVFGPLFVPRRVAPALQRSSRQMPPLLPASCPATGKALRGLVHIPALPPSLAIASQVPDPLAPLYLLDTLSQCESAP